jgi:hypothetical protein
MRLRLWLFVCLVGRVAAAHADTSLASLNAPECDDWVGVKARGGTIAAWTDTRLSASHDGGATFRPIAFAPQSIHAVAIADDGTLFVSTGATLKMISTAVSTRRLPFAGVGWLAAARGRLVAAAIRGGAGSDSVEVAVSRDGGRSWRRLPSPHAKTTVPECCSENASRVAIDGNDNIEILGIDDDCHYVYKGWRYRWQGEKWRTLQPPFDPDEDAHLVTPLLVRRGKDVLALHNDDLLPLDGGAPLAQHALHEATAVAFDDNAQLIVASGRELLRADGGGWRTLLSAPPCVTH